MASNPHPWLLDLGEKVVLKFTVKRLVSSGKVSLYPAELLLFLRMSGKSMLILLKGMKPSFSRVNPTAAP